MSREPVFPNSAHVRAPEWAVLRGGRGTVIELPVRYGRFSHASAGQCLIDTGYSGRVTTGQRSLALQAYAAVLRPRLTPQALPGGAGPVDTILLSHLHADHVSALRDYPDARFYAAATGVAHFVDGPALAGLRHGYFAELLPPDFRERLTLFEDCPLVEAPLGLGPARDVFGDGEVLAVDLPGHMRGHTGFVWPRRDRPLLYAADAQWLHRAAIEDRMPGAPARWILDDADAARTTSRRIADFARAGGEVAWCHDPERR